MSEDFHESYQNEAVKPPSAASTGYVFAAVALIVAVLFRDTSSVWLPAFAVACAFAGVSRIRPALLEPLNRAWFAFAMLLNRVMSPVIMFILFAVVIVPYGLAMQIVRDPLRRRRAMPGESYWVASEPADQHDLRRQF